MCKIILCGIPHFLLITAHTFILSNIKDDSVIRYRAKYYGRDREWKHYCVLKFFNKFSLRKCHESPKGSLHLPKIYPPPSTCYLAS